MSSEADAAKAMRIVALPASGVAYNDCLYDAFRALGHSVVPGMWTGGWLWQNLRPSDVLHIHWPSFCYASKGSALQILTSFARFLVLLAMARWRTRRLWWTAHNLMPHERSAIPWIDKFARVLVIAASSRVFVHGHEARKLLIEQFPSAEGKCEVIPHGHWIGYYQPDHSRASARAALALPESSFVYILFGQQKPYKNLEGLIDAFRKAAAADAILLVAGKFSDSAYLEKMRKLARDDSRIRIDARFIPDDEVSMYMAASDVMCIPYREILTSGSAVLAMSFGKPVISIDRGFLRDMVTPSVGILIEPGKPEMLEAALIEVRRRSWDAQEILGHVGRHTFESAARISAASLD